MSDTTDGIPTNAGAWEYLYDLIVARRAAVGQMPLQFPHARRVIMLAVGVVKLCRDPKDDPLGETVSTTVTAPTIFESGSRLNNESLRTFYVRGGGTLQISCEY
jgi:hypothetical protein